MYKLFIKPFLFLFQPEKAHYLTFGVLKALFVIPGMKALFSAMYRPKNAKPVNVFGLTFQNQVGLAAGFDKDAKFLHELSTIGFGFIEIGTVTPKPQDGNPKPRLFRLPKDEAIINRMGFNNEGVDAAVVRIKAFRKTHPHFIIGGNIGKNKVTPNENAVDDYIYCFEKLFEVVNYFVVNVSSPNTPGLRELQDKAPLTALLSKLQELNKAKPNSKPILLKIAPDLTQEQLDDIIEIVVTTQIAGLIATNTTISRDGLTTPKTVVESIGNGGLSGKPVTSKSTQVIEYITQKSNGSISIIGVGGIHSKQDAEAKIKAGASLVQLYTGFIYEGPSLVKRCVN